MTVNTPFPDRPATPFWDPRTSPPSYGGMAGLGDEQTAARLLDAISAGSMAAERQLTWPSGYGSCPVGMIPNPSTGMCQPGGTVSASASSGVLILVAIGVGLFLFARGR